MFLCLFWSVHLLLLFKPLIFLDILATKISRPESLLSEQSLAQNTIFNVSSPLLSRQSPSHGIQLSGHTQKWGAWAFMREESFRFYLPNFPGGQSPTLQDIFPVGAPVENYVETLETTMSSLQRSDHLFLELSSLVLKDVVKYFFSVPSSAPPPDPMCSPMCSLVPLS